MHNFFCCPKHLHEIVYWWFETHCCLFVEIRLLVNQRIFEHLKQIQTDRQTDILFDVYVYKVIQNGLQYNAHDSGYSNKQDN